jgi:hypothetical protein
MSDYTYIDWAVTVSIIVLRDGIPQAATLPNLAYYPLE